ncbi:hypothetical protein [Streptomyces tritici]|uniref:hypothetical protein n=1 Tax=Streptomyces tritici TaxID=2054410 RepID=UPI003AF1958C
MIWKWVGAALNAAGMSVVAWGLTGLVELGCGYSRRGGCGVPEGGEAHFWAFFVTAALLSLPFKADGYASDWRPSLGLSAGALAGCALALSQGTSLGFWLLALGLVAFGVVTPWATRRHSTAALRRAGHADTTRSG